MKGEIKDEPNWYCQQKAETPFCNNKICKYRHRKHPTPEQFKEEYGEEWKGAVYTKCFNNNCDKEVCMCKKWTIFPGMSDDDPEDCRKRMVTVCACTPFGKPD